jgi:hypothetical protein
MSFVDFITHPAFWVAIFALEEIIAFSPLKSNSIVQFVFQALRLLKGKKG